MYMGRLGKYLGKPECFYCSAGEIELGPPAKQELHPMLVDGRPEAIGFGVPA